LRHCPASQNVACSIPDVVIEIFFWPNYVSGVDSASNRNEYKEYVLGVKVAGV
jgi:hypothetical protein